LVALVPFYAGLARFVHSHRRHGDPTWRTSEPMDKGYSVQVTCFCGVIFERWVLPQDGEDDLLHSSLPSFEL